MQVLPEIIETTLWLTASLLALRRANVGLERHMYPLTRILFVFSGHSLIETLKTAGYQTNIPFIHSLSQPFGPIWVVEKIILLIATLMLIKWVSYYLLKQFQSQIFIALTSSSVLIFLTVTISFTSLLLKNIQTDRYSQLKSEMDLMRYVLENKSAELAAYTKLSASSPSTIPLVESKNRQELIPIAESIATSKGVSSVMFLDKDQKVLVRAENPNQFGDSPLSNSFTARLKSGKSVVSPVLDQISDTSVISIQSAEPIQTTSGIVGFLVIKFPLDFIYLDSVSQTTGLNLTLFTSGKSVATTILSPDSKIPIINQDLPKAPIPWSGEYEFGERYYLTHIEELVDLDNNPLAHLATSIPNSSILETASRSLQTSYLACIILLVVSIVPSFLIARHITKQI